MQKQALNFKNHNTRFEKHVIKVESHITRLEFYELKLESFVIGFEDYELKIKSMVMFFELCDLKVESTLDELEGESAFILSLYIFGILLYFWSVCIAHRLQSINLDKIKKK